jgi:predicted nucleotidyltransferase
MTTLLERLGKQLEAFPAVRLAAVFGSEARGTAHARSDVDLALRLDPDSAALRQEIEVTLARALDRPVEVISMDAASPLLRFEITRDGVLLKESRPYEWADFKVQAMRDWYEWKPYADRLFAAALERLRARVRKDQEKEQRGEQASDRSVPNPLC